MQATIPAALTIPPAVAYEYYNAEKRAVSLATQVVVLPETADTPGKVPEG
jgi:hypothetical protein